MANIYLLPQYPQSLPHDNKSNDPPKSTAPPKYCIKLTVFQCCKEQLSPKVVAVSQKFINIETE